MATHAPEPPIEDGGEWIQLWSENESQWVGMVEWPRILTSDPAGPASIEDHYETSPRTPGSRHGTTDLLGSLRSAERSIRMFSEHERRIVSILTGPRADTTTRAPSGWAQWRGYEDMEVPLDPDVRGGFDNPEPVTTSPLPNPFAEFIPTNNQEPISPFDELIAAVSVSPATRSRRSGPPPPPERFKVRVASVGQLHRATKRNYDYFEELGAALDRQRRSSCSPRLADEPPDLT